MNKPEPPEFPTSDQLTPAGATRQQTAHARGAAVVLLLGVQETAGLTADSIAAGVYDRAQLLAAMDTLRRCANLLETLTGPGDETGVVLNPAGYLRSLDQILIDNGAIRINESRCTQ